MIQNDWVSQSRQARPGWRGRMPRQTRRMKPARVTTERGPGVFNNQPTSVYIVGAGAIGLYLGAHLSSIANVTLVAREPRASQLETDGFTLAGADTGHYRLPIQRVNSTLVLPPDALVLLAVKATDLEKLVGPLSHILHPGQAVGLLQNGLGVHKFVSTYLPHCRLVRITCWVGVNLHTPREAVVAGAPLFELGVDHPNCKDIEDNFLKLFNLANLRARVSGTVAEVEWRKALLNLAVSGICSLVDERNGAILESPELRELVEQILEEALPVAHAEGVVLGADDIERVFTALHNTRHNWNALLQDLRRGLDTEMPFLNAAVERFAKRHKLDAPVNGAIARLIAHVARRQSRTESLTRAH